jgi:hypothetical protein
MIREWPPGELRKKAESFVEVTPGPLSGVGQIV